jgi:hypothetical protein
VADPEKSMNYAPARYFSAPGQGEHDSGTNPYEVTPALTDETGALGERPKVSLKLKGNTHG